MASVQPARIGIVEDDTALRAYLESVVAAAEDLSLAFSAGSLADAHRLAASDTGLDLCLVDINLPDGSGLDFLRHLKRCSAAKCLILTVLGDRATVLLALQSGADGYLLKDTPPDQIRHFIGRTLVGETPISPQAATYLLDIWRGAAAVGRTDQPEEALTAREIEVLKLFSRGLSYREAADTLGISANTIGDHVKAIYRKLGVHSRSEAIFEARQFGLFSPLD